jgi:hypothetical protein
VDKIIKLVETLQRTRLHFVRIEAQGFEIQISRISAAARDALFCGSLQWGESLAALSVVKASSTIALAQTAKDTLLAPYKGEIAYAS